MKYQELYPNNGTDYKRAKLKDVGQKIFGKQIGGIGVRRDKNDILLSLSNLHKISLTQLVSMRSSVNFDFVVEDADRFVADFTNYKKEQVSSLLNYFPRYAVTVAVENCPSLHNIHKHVKQIRDMFYIENMTTTHLLGLLLIQGPFCVSMYPNYVDANKNISNIINKYLTSNRDINACQEELIEAGFTEQAKL